MDDTLALRRLILAALASGAFPACGATVAPSDAAADRATDVQMTGPDATPDVLVDAAVQESSLPTTCPSPNDRYEQRCMTESEAIRQAMNPPGDILPTDGGRPIPDGGILPNGCVAPQFMQSGCCNPAVALMRQGSTCCYVWCETACCGRPLSVSGRARVAEPVTRTDWSDPCEDPAGTTSHAVHAARDAFVQDGLLEHASVASFARLALELMAHGAPPELLEAVLEAGRDEIRHAHTCFSLARALDPDATPQGPGPLDLSGLRVQRSLAEIAFDAARDGCVGETLSALYVRAQARNAKDSVIAAALDGIATDEARHAALSWRIVAWALGTGDRSVRDAVVRAFEPVRAGTSAGPLPAPAPADVEERAWCSFGRVGTEQAHALRADAILVVVRPAIEALGLVDSYALESPETALAS